MTKGAVVIYARVSSEEQAKGEAVSIDGQLSDMLALVARNGWQVVSTHIDSEDYKATQDPKRGRIVNPSGERADRPQFLKLLERVKAGEADIILCWRDDRLVRHPRAAAALTDAIDSGNVQRKGSKIRLCDATGAEIDEFRLSLMAAIWQQENKRRAERVRLGKVGTLKDGRWPGEYLRLGYAVHRELGRRGVEIVLGDKSEVETVRLVFNWYDAGCSLQTIQERLIARGAAQKGRAKRWQWNTVVLSEMLAAEDYTGTATWTFGDGTTYPITIPPIITHEQWDRAQKRRQVNSKLSTRNAGDVYLLQGLLYCGDCGGLVSPAKIKHFYKRMANGETKRYDYLTPRHQYRCVIGNVHHEGNHPHPYRHPGEALDWRVWRALVDKGIKHPELILEQVRARQAKLQAERNSFDGSIAEAKNKLAAIDAERADYQRQKGRKKITEKEFDERMDETAQSREYWQGEIARLRELRDDAAKIKAGMDYTVQLMASIEESLPEIDQTPDEMRCMPDEQRQAIMQRRQIIVRALVDKITIWASGRLVIDGLIDGDEGEQFGLVVS